MKTRLIAWLVCLALLCLNASEPWQFLPNFQCDVRGVEMASKIDANFFDSLPATAEKLLSADSPLTELQRDELYWRPARFPHRDFVNLKSQRKLSNPSAFIMHIPFIEASGTIETIGIMDTFPFLFPKLAIRRAAWWDDHGEMHPFDDTGPDMTWNRRNRKLNKHGDRRFVRSDGAS